MTEENEEKARKAGVEFGRMLASIDDLIARVGRLEKILLGLVGAIAAAWAKSKGLW
jgi:uncharacterized membrane protein YeaQ/YmgE (transglycosylase-associated protein family)